MTVWQATRSCGKPICLGFGEFDRNTIGYRCLDNLQSTVQYLDVWRIILLRKAIWWRRVKFRSTLSALECKYEGGNLIIVHKGFQFKCILFCKWYTLNPRSPHSHTHTLIVKKYVSNDLNCKTLEKPLLLTI